MPPWIRRQHPSSLRRALAVVVVLLVQVVEHHVPASEAFAAVIALEWKYCPDHAVVVFTATATGVISSVSIIRFFVCRSLRPRS